MADDLITELEDALELGRESLLQLLCLIASDRLFAEVENLLRQELENVECVFALGL